jgi:hypothetical protein
VAYMSGRPLEPTFERRGSLEEDIRLPASP